MANDNHAAMAEEISALHFSASASQIKELGAKAGVVLNPGTSLSQIEDVLDCCDLILIMSVNPGFGGQKFIETQVAKIRKLREMCKARVSHSDGSCGKGGEMW